MSVIIRLQNLPWSANALDIRQYFRGLSIPEGGVHIVGGELGDAFIAFSTDEDARQAFQLNNGKIKEIQIKLLLSSRTEMQKVIEAARTAPFMQAVATQPGAVSSPSLIPQISSLTQANLVSDHKKDEKDSKNSKEDSKSRSRDRGRRRSRSRTRSRDRKDRSRDRRDRRRRDRTRSRDRRDRRRDNRRGRSRSRDRTRSKDRDSRRSRDDKKDNRDPKLIDGGVIEIKDDNSNSRVWEQNTDSQNNEIKIQQPGLLGNYPAPTALEDARRSLGLLTGIQHNMPSGPMNIGNRMPRNDVNNTLGNRDNWRKNRFPENNEMGMMNQFNQNNLLVRPNMNQMGLGPNILQNQPNVRPPFHQDNFILNRPFMPRPGTLFSDQFRGQQFGSNDESFRNDSRKKGECCVQLRPYYGGYGEVRKFFHGLFISNTGVKFVSENGRRNGIVYIKFVRPEGKDQALTRSGMMLRGVPVEVTHLDDEEWDCYGEDDHQKIDDNLERQDLDQNNSPLQLQHFTCVLVDDLQEFTKEHDILKLFSDYTLMSVHMIMNNQYHQQAYVQFSKEEDAKNAVMNKTSHVINGKPVTVRPISDDAFAKISQQSNGEIEGNFPQNDNLSPRQSNLSPHIITDCVMLTGLPHKTTDRDVLDFFSDIGIIPTRIHIMMNKFGPSGECFCEFNNPDEALCAVDKSGMPLGTGTVRVELYLRRDMERALGIPPVSNPMAPGPRFPNRFGPRGPTLLGPRPPPNMIRRRPPGPGMRYDGPVESMGPPGCVVTMENVPFKAGVDEILDFFASFELSSHNVFRRFNDNGAPTGDARVTFNSPGEAHRAVEECNKLKIRDRTIFLRVL